MITSIDNSVDFVVNNKLTTRSYSYLDKIRVEINSIEDKINNLILSGSGTPEGNITASPKTLYMDSSGTTGSILWIKKSGTNNTGWILV